MTRARAKAAQIGSSVAALVHELRQPLFAVKARLQLAELGPGTLDAEGLREILDHVAHLEELLDHAQLDASPSLPPRADLGEEVHRALAMLAPQAGGIGVRLDVRVPSVPVPVRCRPVALRQIVLNLARNALDAVVGAERKVVRVEITLGDGVCLEVEDSGPGLPPDVVRRLFEPYLTTKGQGTGLGLFIARRLIEEAGGTLVARHGTPGAHFVANFVSV